MKFRRFAISWLLCLAGMCAGSAASADSGETEKNNAATIIRASAAGAALDSSLETGGGTDDTAVLQGVLNKASDGRPVHLFVDGAALVSGLDVYSNTTIECVAGGGLYLKDDSVRALIRNAHRSRSQVIDRNITLRGCFLHGNRDHQIGMPGPVFEGSPLDREADGTYMAALQFFGVEHFTMEDTVVFAGKSFGVWIANAKYIHLNDITVDDGRPVGLSISEQQAVDAKYVTTDGIHFGGPIQHVTASGLKIKTKTDALAIIANYDGVTEAGPYVRNGPITDVAISNVIISDNLIGVRFLSATDRIDRVVIQNVAGTVRRSIAILSSHLTPGHDGNFGTITISNVNVDATELLPPFTSIEDWLADASLSAPLREWAKQKMRENADLAALLEWPVFSLESPIESLNLHQITSRVVGNKPIIRVGSHARVSLLKADLSILDPTFDAVPVKLVKGGHVDRMKLSLDWVGDSPDPGKNPILDEGGVIEQLQWVGTPSSYGKH